MPKNSHRLTFRTLICVAVGLIGLSVLAIGLTIWGLRADAIRDADTDTGNIAVVLSEQMSRSIQSIDIVLSDIREKAARPEHGLRGGLCALDRKQRRS